MRLVIARCKVDYVGRLTAHLPMARRLLMIKADGSVLVHSDGGSYKPLNWMSPPCWFNERDVTEPADELPPGVTPLREGQAVAPNQIKALWVVTNKAGEELRISIEEIFHDFEHDLGIDPGLQKDGVEAHLQALLAEHVTKLGEGYTLVRREYMTAIGPVDLLCRNADGATVAVEIKRRGDIDGVEQLTRYLELLNRDPVLAPVTGVFAAQQIKPQARTLAEDRGIRCLTLDYDELRGTESNVFRLF
ncbi:endonuclease NucS [Nocardia camponoti]|uniref:Endonuclease NucS n=1 Tax=Nocardia camponoti TaxID=1616106 RepID=A0A917VFE8_9NOCA|nr:endonuclease NucS [Nocardia camponoti]GGK70135.1 endonuclease NucS [Nocardia camponoti]